MAHADAFLKATPPEQRTDFKPTERDKQLTLIEQIVKLEKEMSQLQTQYKDAVKSYITRHESEILDHFELVVNTASMEEAVQQQLEAGEEFGEDPDSNGQPNAENNHPDSENDNSTLQPGDNVATK